MTGLSDSDKKVLDDVERYGWHVVKVMGDDTAPGFGYSVGFFKTFGQPELIIIGLKLDLIHSVINDIGQDLKNGRDYQSGRFYSGLIDGYDCYFITVNVRFYFEYVGYARWFYKGDSFPLLQRVYPTKKNIYPWQREWPKEISNLQPILAEDGVTFP